MMVFAAAILVLKGCGSFEAESEPYRFKGERPLFGYNISMAGETALIASDTPAGAVYVYEWAESAWSRIQTLTGSGEGDDPGFGMSIAGHESLFVVGERNMFADGHSPRVPGSVHVFDRSAGKAALAERLTEKYDGNDVFGGEVAVSTEWIAAGALKASPREDTLHTGMVYAYRRTEAGLAEPVVLAPDGLINGDHFGLGLDMNDDYMAVGASLGTESYTGAVYVFAPTAEGWTLEQKLIPQNAAPGDDFGEVLALDGTHLLVAATGSKDFQGNAYIFERQGEMWVETATLSPDLSQSTQSFFGDAVDISDGVAVVSSIYENRGRGAVYVFERQPSGEWVGTQRLTAPQRQQSALFGDAVAIDGDRLLIGAPGEDAERGAVYAFTRTSDGWVPLGK